MEINTYIIYGSLFITALNLSLSIFLLIVFRRCSAALKRIKNGNPNADAIQKIGIVKFSGFNEMGGKVSFCLALLNEKDEGLVMTSLTSRDFSRVYIRDIKTTTGKNSDSDLSSEELEAVKRAKNYGR